METPLVTERLIVRDWTTADTDAQAALEIYGVPEVTEQLTPVMPRVGDLDAMRSVLQAWVEAAPNLVPPTGRWAIQLREDEQIVGGLTLRLLPPYHEDLEVTWQLRPEAWGKGYATESCRALIRWAFTHDVDEVFAVARSENDRAVKTARRIGMEWVGETTKYYDTLLQVFRIRPGDLDEAEGIRSRT